MDNAEAKETKWSCETCGEPATSICAKCREMNCSESALGRYCCRKCQVDGFETHKHFHKIFKRSSNDMSNRGCPETIVTAIKEAVLRGINISLGSSNELSILIVGCRD